jgi:hypothetical protein
MKTKLAQCEAQLETVSDKRLKESLSAWLTGLALDHAISPEKYQPHELLR